MPAKFRFEYDAAAVHGLRGRPSNRALPRSLRQKTLDVARDPLREDFGPTLLAEHLERETGRRAGVETMRRWLLEAGLWERRRKRAKHRSRRPRRLALGELAQWDSSAHQWLQDWYPGELRQSEAVELQINPELEPSPQDQGDGGNRHHRQNIDAEANWTHGERKHNEINGQ